MATANAIESKTQVSPFDEMKETGFVVPKTKTRRYHVGMKREGPAFSYHLAGVEFPRHTIRYGPATAAGEREEYREDGAILNLTDAQVTAAFEKSKHIFVRWHRDDKGEVMRATIFADDNRMFQMQAGDESIQKHIYCRLLPDEVKNDSFAAIFELPPGVAQAAAETAKERAIEEGAKASEAESRAKPGDDLLRAQNARLKVLPNAAVPK